MRFILLYLSFTLLFLGSCNKGATSRKQTVAINICSEPVTLDPRRARDLNDVTIMHMLFEGLTRVSKEGSIELALAESVEISDDYKRFEFHLKRTSWSNGDQLTADHFADSWKSSLNPSFPTDVSYQLYPIKGAKLAKKGEIGLDQIGVQVTDPYTLVVELEISVPYFLEILTLPIFFPVHPSALTNPNWCNEIKTHIGNGPFVLSSWKHADEISVKKNRLYWEGPSVKLEEIQMVMLHPETEIRFFEDGKIDWAGSPLSIIPIDLVAPLKAQGFLQVGPLAGTYFLRVNVSNSFKGAANPLSHPLLRRSLSLAVDRNAIAKHILQGGQTPADRLVPKEMGLQSKHPDDLSLETARAYCDQAYAELQIEKTSPLILSFSSGDRNASIAQALQKQWQDRLGISVVLEAIEPKTYYQKISGKDYQMAAGSWIADFNDPINFLEVFKYKNGSTNNTGWENSDYIEILTRSDVSPKEEERRLLLAQAEEILMRESPIIPIFHFAKNYLQKSGLKDVALSPIGQIDFRWAYLE